MEPFPWWSDAHRQLCKEVHEFADEMIPRGVKASLRRELPLDLIDMVAKRGWFGAMVPEEYGGMGLGVTGACIVVEGLSRIGIVSHVYTTTMFGGLEQILHWGTEEQKRKWVPKIAEGKLIGAITITEPFVGSDAASIETVAVRDGDEYVLKGKKRFITNAGLADIYMTYAKTSDDPKDKAQYRHLTAFILEKGMPGLTVERINELCGWDGLYNGYLDIDDVRVPAENRLGEEGDGWRILVSGLNVERTISSAGTLGQMREAIRNAIYHSQRRVQFGQPTFYIQENQFKIADMLWRYRTARLLTFYAAYLIDRGEEAVLEATIAKMFNAEAFQEVAIGAVQVMGGDGWTRYYPAELYYRNSKIYPIIAGTNEIMKVIIARQGVRRMSEEFKPPWRYMDEELKMPIPYLKRVKPLYGSSGPLEEKLLKVLAEYYRVNPGLHMSRDELKEELQVSDEELDKVLQSLEEKKLVSLYRHPRTKQIILARATYEGLSKANPPEYYKMIPSWVREDIIF